MRKTCGEWTRVGSPGTFRTGLDAVWVNLREGLRASPKRPQSLAHGSQAHTGSCRPRAPRSCSSRHISTLTFSSVRRKYLCCLLRRRYCVSGTQRRIPPCSATATGAVRRRPVREVPAQLGAASPCSFCSPFVVQRSIQVR